MLRPEMNQPRPVFVPLICQKPNCGGVWFVSYGRFPEGSGITVRGDTFINVGSCPKCGFPAGSTADGYYTPLGGRLFSQKDLELVINALKQLQAKASAGATTDQVATEISKSYPFLEPIKRYLPKDAKELAGYLAAAAAIYAVLHRPPSDTHITNIYAPQELHQSLELAPDRQEHRHPHSHKSKK
jgi:hypothetical protein